MKYKLYEVGGKIRDEFLGINSKDVDYSVIIDDKTLNLKTAYKLFVEQIKTEGYSIKVESPDVLTVRALFPKTHKYSGIADFVIARKELYYPEGSRRPVCELGNLEDDLLRRDFTVNALAKGENGEIIDLFNGIEDLNDKILDTPADPLKTFRDDPLRVIRGMRFSITKGFELSPRVQEAIRELGREGLEKVSIERVRDELDKCLRYSTYSTLKYLNYMEQELHFDLNEYAFNNTGLKLIPCNKKK